MTHFGIICRAASGHLNPITTLGYELQKRGHHVTVFGVPDAQSRILAATRLSFQVIGEFQCPLGSTEQFFDQQAKIKGFALLRHNIILAEKSEDLLLREASKAIKQTGVEALLVDQVSVAGGTVAEFLNIPFISFCSDLLLNQEEGVPPFFTSWRYNPARWAHLRNRAGFALLNSLGRPIWKLIAKYRREWKLPTYSHPNDAFSQLAQVSQQPAEFEYPRQHLPQCLHFVGSCLNPALREPIPFPFERLSGQPLIYASLGTVFSRRLEIYHKISEACVGLNAQLVIDLAGTNSPEALSELPGTPLVVRKAPQLELLKRASLTITHAGMNTVLESMSNGVPMVAIPLSSSTMPGIATRIAWSGAGEVLPFAHLSVPRLRDAIKRVLAEESYKKNAIRLQEAIRRGGGVSRAADIVEQAISTGKPVLCQ